MKKLERYYWDSTCFIAWLKPEPENVPGCREVLEAAQAGKLQIVTSAIALTEVIKLNKGPLILPPETAQKIRDFFKNDYIVIVQLTRQIAEDARDLVWRFQHLKPKDAVHLASAQFAGLSQVHSFDEDFLKLDGMLGNPGQSIRRPQMPQRSLALEPPALPSAASSDKKADEVN